MSTLISPTGVPNTQQGTSGAAHTAAHVIASNGVALALDGLAQTLAYSPDGTLASVSVTHAGTTYRQSLTYTAGKLTAVSAWEAQP